jgi:hypothetical protein
MKTIYYKGVEITRISYLYYFYFNNGFENKKQGFTAYYTKDAKKIIDKYIF